MPSYYSIREFYGNYKEINSIKAGEYLAKAEKLFRKMDQEQLEQVQAGRGI